MKYKVIRYFKDAKDNKKAYHPGEEYPREGLQVSKERLEELSTDKNCKGVPFIEAVPEKKQPKAEKPKEAEPQEEPKPKRTRKKNAD